VSTENDAPGWQAIEDPVARVVAPQEPLHWGTDTLPGQDGIYGLSAYRSGDHWLLVTFGLTDLFDKADGEDPAISGWGFELTMRVPVTDDKTPNWTLRLLRQLGRYVYQGGKPLSPGHRMDPGGPITGATGTRLTALAFVDDPQLPAFTSVNGHAEFRTAVGITGDELARMKATSTAEVIRELAAASPLLVTDPGR
jgi:Suppressor of fused protein (SUFU)